MIKNDQRGQISAELILLLGIIFVVVIVIATQVGHQSEANKISVSAKEGALQALANESIMSRSFVPNTVESIRMNGTDNVQVTLILSQPLSTSEYERILDKTLDNIKAQGYDRNGGASNSTSSDDYISSAQHNYFIQLAW